MLRVCLTCASRLHDEIVAFYEYVSPTPDERHARAMVIAQVAEVVKRRLPKASVDPFGSVAQDLYLPDGYVRSVSYVVPELMVRTSMK